MSPEDFVPEIELTLYVSGASERAARAIRHARSLCDTCLAGRHRLSIHDINADLEGFLRSGAGAAPALVRTRPPPTRMLVGDLSDPDRVLAALGLRGGLPPPTDGR